MKTAIILAAGVGSRLRPLTERLPKCCIRVGGKTIIRRMVEQLRRVAPSVQIYVVTGYLGDIVKIELNEYRDDIFFIENVKYASTNNMESCRLALEARPTSGPSLIINADCVYDDDIMTMAASVESSCIVVDTGVYNNENMKVRVEGGWVCDISKSIRQGNDVATSVDLYFFDDEDIDELWKIMQAYDARGVRDQWTEVAIAELVRRRNVGIIDISGKRWMEIDNSDDLEIANSMFSR